MKVYKPVCSRCGQAVAEGTQCACWWVWWVEVEMPDGDQISTRIRGTAETVCKHYEDQGARVMRLERLDA